LTIKPQGIDFLPTFVDKVYKVKATLFPALATSSRSWTLVNLRSISGSTTADTVENGRIAPIATQTVIAWLLIDPVVSILGAFLVRAAGQLNEAHIKANNPRNIFFPPSWEHWLK
jgi:hypothetical protein